MKRKFVLYLGLLFLTLGLAGVVYLSVNPETQQAWRSFQYVDDSGMVSGPPAYNSSDVEKIDPVIWIFAGIGTLGSVILITTRTLIRRKQRKSSKLVH